MVLYDLILQNNFILPILVVITFTIFYKYTYIHVNRRKNLPPGPKAIVPILGNLFGLSPGNIIQKFRGYRDKYGDIYTLNFGSRTVIVVNGYDTLRDMFVKNADVFSHRPSMFVFDLFDGHGILTTSGDLWKEHRSFALAALRSFGFGKKSFESNIMEEVNVLITSLEETKGANFDINHLIHTCISNVICSIVFGKRFEHTDPLYVELLDMFDESVKLSGVAGPLNFIPFVKYIPGDPFKYHLVIQSRDKVDSFVNDIIQEHMKTYQPGSQRDFIDAFLDERAKHQNEPGSTFNDKQLLKEVEEFFLAGTETTATSLKWALLYLLNNPEVQTKMRKEIESVVGPSKFPSYTNRASLPYCEAVIIEILRCCVLLPFSLSHAASRDTTFKGYNIPKDAIIFPNLDSVMMDDSLFPEPARFNPERFIDEQGNLFGQEKVIAFSLGRQVCLGESLARMELFLFLTTMIQRFQFKPEEGKPAPTPEGVLGITNSPKSFLIRAEKIS